MQQYVNPFLHVITIGPLSKESLAHSMQKEIPNKKKFNQLLFSELFLLSKIQTYSQKTKTKTKFIYSFFNCELGQGLDLKLTHAPLFMQPNIQLSFVVHGIWQLCFS